MLCWPKLGSSASLLLVVLEAFPISSLMEKLRLSKINVRLLSKDIMLIKWFFFETFRSNNFSLLFLFQSLVVFHCVLQKSVAFTDSKNINLKKKFENRCQKVYVTCESCKWEIVILVKYKFLFQKTIKNITIRNCHI